MPCFTGCLCVLAIIVAVACTASISEVYYMRGADLLAKQAATAMASTAHQKVDAFMNGAYSDADSLQFMILMSQRRLPRDGIAMGRFDYDNWSNEYLSMCSMLLRGSEFMYSYISFSFDDGSAAICQRGTERDTFETVSSISVPGRDDSFLSVSTVYSYNGIFIRRALSNESYDARYRSWYSNVPQGIMAKQWSPIGYVGMTPAASLVAAMVNSSQHFLGAISVSFSIENVSSLLKQAKPVISSDIFLLDGKFDIVGSTRAQPTSTSRVVPNNYVPTAQEKLDGCILSDTGSEVDYALLTCHHNIESYGYAPLKDVYRDHRELLDDMDDIVNVERVRVGGAYYYVSVMGLSYSSLNAWRIVCFISEEEITESVRAGREVVIWVSVVIGVLVAVISVALAKFLLSPLSRIASLMGSAAYLSHHGAVPDDTDDLSVSSEGFEFDRQRRMKAEQAQKELLKERKLSFWMDVRAIQCAYWSMADQLGELQGYIPEHVRDGIVELHQKAPDQGGAHASPALSSYTHTKEKDREMEALKLTSSFTGAESPRLDFETLQTVVNQHAQALSNGAQGGGFTEIVPSNHEALAVSPVPIPSAAVVSTRGGNDALDGESFDDVSVAAARIAYGAGDTTPVPIIFGDNVLVDRDITVVHINILQFHTYAQMTHGRTITEEHETIVNFIYTAARRCGGNLDNFIGDKFWISFNATSKCLDGPIVAACLAMEVTSIMNRDALEGQHRRRINHERRVQNLQPLSRDTHPRHRFRAAPFGVSCGISTGRAFVGPLGTKAIKRHSILSNTFTEASALERLSLRYPGCSTMIGGDMIPAIEGYFQYLIMDASLLPGSGGKRRRIASLKGPMLSPGRNPQLHKGGIRREMPFRPDNPYKGINDCFNAFLEGRMDDCARTLREVDIQTAETTRDMASIIAEREKERRSRVAHHGTSESKMRIRARERDASSHESDRERDDTHSSAGHSHFNTVSLVSLDVEEQCAEISLMSRLLWSILAAPTPVDGRLYRSPFGEMYMPVTHALRLVVKSVEERGAPPPQNSVPAGKAPDAPLVAPAAADPVPDEYSDVSLR